MKRYNDFVPDEENIPDMDDRFAELCLDSLGAQTAPVSETDEPDEEEWAAESPDERAPWGGPRKSHPKAWDDPETWAELDEPDEELLEPMTPAPAVPVKEPTVSETPTPTVQPKATHAAPAKSPKKKAKKRRGFLLGLIPQKGDSKWEIIRKCVCMVALIVFIGSACVLLNDFVIEPMRGASVSNAARDRNMTPITPDEANFDGYPAGILESLKKNYYHNHDLIGWITYPSESDYWYGVDYPIVQRPGDNDYYLKRDFDKNENKNGSIFMDFRCDYATADSDCRVTLIYGHNMRDGQMFASLNQLLDLSMARCAPTFTFSSLFEENDYKVFAVFNVDTAEADAYDFLNQSLVTDDDFVRYIAEMRVRSWFDYSSVDVSVSDDIVVLYTCSNTYQTSMGSSGRTLVAARKVRPGESVAVDSSTITENKNCVMPKVWYTNNGLSLPSYYQSGVPAAYLDAVSRTTPSTAATTKPTTTKTTKPTTTTATRTDDEPEPNEPEDDDDVIAPTAAVQTTRTAAPTQATTKPTAPPTTAPTETPTTETPVTETQPTEPEPTEPEPTDPEPTEASSEQGHTKPSDSN